MFAGASSYMIRPVERFGAQSLPRVAISLSSLECLARARRSIHIVRMVNMGLAGLQQSLPLGTPWWPVS